MKASKAEAKKAIAAESQAQDLAEVRRKVDLILAHFKIAEPGPDAGTLDGDAPPAPADSAPPTEAEEAEAEAKAEAEKRVHRRRR